MTQDAGALLKLADVRKLIEDYYFGPDKWTLHRTIKALEVKTASLPEDCDCVGAVIGSHDSSCRQAASQGRSSGEAVAWRDIVTLPDERPLPTYGQIPWDQLGRDVTDACTARRNDYEFKPSYYPGHQIVSLNFNSLARIVDKYRYYGLPCTDLSPPVKTGGE